MSTPKEQAELLAREWANKWLKEGRMFPIYGNAVDEFVSLMLSDGKLVKLCDAITALTIERDNLNIILQSKEANAERLQKLDNQLREQNQALLEVARAVSTYTASTWYSIQSLDVPFAKLKEKGIML